MKGRYSVRQRPKKVHGSDVNCNNCKFMKKGMCLKLTELSGGTQRYVSSKTIAKKCKFFTNKNL